MEAAETQSRCSVIDTADTAATRVKGREIGVAIVWRSRPIEAGTYNVICSCSSETVASERESEGGAERIIGAAEEDECLAPLGGSVGGACRGDVVARSARSLIRRIPAGRTG